MNRHQFREASILIGTVIVLLLPFALVGAYMAQKYQSMQERIAEIEPRHARLLGLDIQKGDLDRTLKRVQELQAQYLYPASQDATQAGNAAQQRVRDLFTKAGLQVISSQVLQSKTENGFDRIPLTVRAEGDQLSLQSALAALSEQTPAIIVGELDIQVLGGNSTGPVRFAGIFSLSVLRVHT